jgi:hypothetical protein
MRMLPRDGEIGMAAMIWLMAVLAPVHEIGVVRMQWLARVAPTDPDP